MSLSLTYDAALSRVRAAVTGLVDATWTLQRSTDQIRWTTVRGGVFTPSGGAATIDDYEFAADVPNFYRVRGPGAFDDFNRSASNGAGTLQSGQVTSTSGGLAADYSVNGSKAVVVSTDVGVLRAILFDVGSSDHRIRVMVDLGTGAVAGGSMTARVWLRAADVNNQYDATVTFTTGDLVQLGINKRVAGSGSGVVSPVTVATSYNAGDQLMVDFEAVGSTLRAKAWLVASQAEPGDWQVQGTDTSLTAGNLIGLACRRETGNTNTNVQTRWDNLAVRTPSATTFTANITPTLDGVWLKSVVRPFLNRTVEVRDYSEFSRSARAGVFPVVGRSLPVAVTDLRSSKRWTLLVNTHDAAEARELDLMLSAGDILFVHVPTTGRLSTVPGGYVAVGDTSEQVLPTHDLALRVFSLPCTAVAAPGPDVVGVTYTCAGVLNDYATCADLLAAFATCADLLDNVGSAEDVIVQ